MYLELSHSFHGCTQLHWSICHNLFTQSSMDRHLSSFQCFAITNNVPMHMFVNMSFLTHECVSGPKPLKYYTLFTHLLVWLFLHSGPKNTEMNWTWSPPWKCWQRWWTSQGRSVGHSWLWTWDWQPIWGLTSKLLDGWELMSTTHILILPCTLPKPFWYGSFLAYLSVFLWMVFWKTRCRL